jgi:hypothetical protein
MRAKWILALMGLLVLLIAIPTLNVVWCKWVLQNNLVEISRIHTQQDYAAANRLMLTTNIRFVAYVRGHAHEPDDISAFIKPICFPFGFWCVDINGHTRWMSRSELTLWMSRHVVK